MHGFAVLHVSIPGTLQNLTSSSVTVAQINSWRENEVLPRRAVTVYEDPSSLPGRKTIFICPRSGVFKTFAGNMSFRVIIGTEKKKKKKKKKNNFSKHVLPRRVIKCVYAIIAIKHDFLMLGPSRNRRLSGSCLNTSLWAQQMLICRKSRLIPIVKDAWEQP